MEVAVFPIPEMVAFPGQSHKLHVFEPRYRELMRYSFERDCMVGLALPLKTISESNIPTDLDPLSVNHDIYKAANLMGAGYPKLLQELDDGRMMVQIDVNYRVKVKRLVQNLPFYIAEAEIVPDLCGDAKRADSTVDRLLGLSSLVLGKEITVGGPVAGITQHRIRAVLLWVTSWFQMEPSQRQKMLEHETAVDQAEFLCRELQSYLNKLTSKDPMRKKQGVRRDGNLIEIDF